MSLGRGKKKCPKCSTVTGPRAYRCKNCGFDYKIQKGSSKVTQKKKGERVDWKELEKGNFVKVISGSGPYFLLDGVREPMGYSGKFVVHALGVDGFHAYPLDKKNSGHCYIYMGERKTDTETGIIKRPHKIRKIKQPKVTNTVLSRKYNG